MLLTDINKQTLFASVSYKRLTNNIKKINREIFGKYWLNLKQLMRNSEFLWRKSKKINTKKPDSVYEITL